MPIEIEAKIKVAELDSIRQRIRDAGGEHLGDFHEANTFFDTADQRLRKADEGLRIRLLTNLKGPRGMGTGRTQCILTFKGPAMDSPLKQREELETLVDDESAIVTILRQLGYMPRLTFEKRRQSWRLKDCRIELDEVPLLGTFIEIEGASVSAVESARIALGLANEPLIKTGYSAMLAGELKRIGGGTEARF